MKGGDKVLIIGYHGMGNVGAELRLRVLVSDIRKANPRAEITIAKFKYQPMTRIKGTHYLLLNNVFTGVFETIKKIPKFDYVISGEGIPFVDFCGSGFIDYFLPVLYFAHLFGKKTACYSFDFDYMNHFHKWLAIKVLKNVDMLVVRTEKTYSVLKEDGIRKNLHLGTDSSLLFKIKKRETGGEKIGFCLKDFYCYPIKLKLFKRKKDCYHHPYYYSYTSKEKKEYKQFIREMAKLIDNLVEEDKKLIIQMIVMEVQMDYQIAKDIYNSVKNKKNVEIISRKTHTLMEIVSNFQNLNCLVAARYHAVVLGIRNKVPTLVLSTDERFDYFVQELGLKRFLIEVYKEKIDVKKIAEFIREENSNKKIFSEKISKKLPILEKRAKNNYKFLKKFFELPR
jgi:polysaccharide pyruvyl transferase WcaK-like protein